MGEQQQAATTKGPTAAAKRAADAIGKVGHAGLHWIMVEAGRIAEREGITAEEAVETMAARIIDRETGLPELLKAAKGVLDLVESEGRDTGTGGPFSDLRGAVELAENGRSA